MFQVEYLMINIKNQNGDDRKIFNEHLFNSENSIVYKSMIFNNKIHFQE